MAELSAQPTDAPWLCRQEQLQRDEPNSRKNRGQKMDPHPFYHIASSHHPSVRGRITWALFCWPACIIWRSALTRRRPPHIWSLAFGRVPGSGAGKFKDPTVCSEGSDESSGLVRLAMKPQWKRSMTNGPDFLREEPSAVKGTARGRQGGMTSQCRDLWRGRCSKLERGTENTFHQNHL